MHDAKRMVQTPLDRDELLALMQNSLESLAVQLGLLVASDILVSPDTKTARNSVCMLRVP
jgi:hypothetical protein